MDETVIREYRNSTARLFLLDYDGVLAEIVANPADAAPTPEVLSLLQQLSNDTKNTVVIISGRNHADLDAWLGALPVHFAAEHGLLYKSPGQPWTTPKNLDTSWKPRVSKLFTHYINALPGSFIEDKTNGMVWHYRQVADQVAAEAAAQRLQHDLKPVADQYGLRIMLGSKIVETQPIGVSKGVGATYWLQQRPWDFVLAAGDDVTDEDTFAALPPAAHTIKVGTGDTIARYRQPTPAAMRASLASLAKQQ